MLLLMSAPAVPILWCTKVQIMYALNTNACAAGSWKPACALSCTTSGVRVQAGEKVLSLEWLRDRSAEEARAYLMSIDGEDP